MPSIRLDRFVTLRRPVPLSVLDLSPIVSGSSARDALANSLDLVRRAEALGFTRYWVAEHHNMPGIASSAPAVLIGHLAAATSRIRVGSGGVMLPNHAPLVVAEQFGMLEALHPGRIDLGIGRAPGTDPLTAHALRRPAGTPRRDAPGADDFPQQLGEVLAFFEGSFPDEHPYQRITATPALGFLPDVWLLGSSGFSAQLAGLLGLPFSFAHHFSSGNTLPALDLYRRSFEPGPYLSEPYASIGVNVVVADTDEEAERLARPMALSMLRLRTGRPGPLPSNDEAAAHVFTPDEQAVIDGFARSRVIGDVDSVTTQLDDLLEATGVQELVVTTNLFEHADRVRSYERLAEIAGLPHADEPSDATVETAEADRGVGAMATR